MRKDLLILLLLASTAVALMFSLMTLRVAGDAQDRADKLAQQLYVESLKRDYFEWRDGTATGHAPGVEFERQKE